MCVDYRPLNALTVKDQYDLPRIDIILASLLGLKWFSKFDMRKRYHYVGINEAHIHKSVFKCHYGTFEYLGMFFCQTNNGKTFQRVVC